MNIPTSMLKFLWHFIRKQRAAFSLALFFALVWAFNESIFPYLLKLIINTVSHYQGERSQIYSVLVWPISIVISMWCVMEICMRLQGLTMLHAFPRLRANIRSSVFAYVKEHSHEYFANHFSGSIANKISDLSSSSERILEIIIFNFIPIFAALLVAVVLLWNANIAFALLMIAWVCVHLSLSLLFLRKANKLAEIHSQSVSTLSGKIVDCLTNILNVRSFARSRYENQFLQRHQDEEVDKAKRSLWHIEKMRFLQGISGLAFIFANIFMLIYAWTHNMITIGDFTLVSMLSFNMLGLIWFVSFQVIVFIREASKINAALDLISVKHAITDKENATSLKIAKGGISFEHVTFSYKKNTNVFEDLNVNIQPGEKVGLVGFSGSGKSTFVNLILRFYDINKGKILIDQQNIANVTQESLREAIAMIPQDPSLFHRTLMENIRYGRINASNDEVIRAAKLAHCHEFITQLDEDYQTLVGERGIKLSGGQRQRIAIARAILKNAPILILDEATSSLDSVTEKLIQESLNQLMKDKTTIVVAHRLSTLADMDRIIVFHQGSVVEDGSMKKLLAAKEHFARLWKMQSHGFLPESSH